MRSKPERTFRTQPDTATDSENTDPKTVIRVKRGALRRFDQLTTKSTGLPVEIKWDRRTGERRATDDEKDAAERRNGDRRQAPPFTWETAEFVVVGDRPKGETAEAAEPARADRKAGGE